MAETCGCFYIMIKECVDCNPTFFLYIFVRISEHNGDVLSKNYKHLVEVLCSNLSLRIAVLWYRTPCSLVVICQLLKKAAVFRVYSEDEYASFSETTRRHTPADSILHSHGCKNLGSYTNIQVTAVYAAIWSSTGRETQFNILTNNRPNYCSAFSDF